MSYLNHQLPDKRPDESNEDWCRRAAESIPAEELMRAVVLHFSRPTDRRPDGWSRAWLMIAEITGHGSGVSTAIVRRFMDKPEDLKGSP